MTNDSKMRNFKHQNYLAMQIQSATPESLVLIVYEGIIKYANMTKILLRNQNLDIEKINDYLKRCFGLTVELSNALQFDVWEGAGELARLYDFVIQEFIEANLKKLQPDESIKHIDSALSVITELNAAWQDGVNSARQVNRTGALMEAKG